MHETPWSVGWSAVAAFQVDIAQDKRKRDRAGGNDGERIEDVDIGELTCLFLHLLADHAESLALRIGHGRAALGE